ncbi:ERF family protein [Acinetobacter calcoaceticus]
MNQVIEHGSAQEGMKSFGVLKGLINIKKKLVVMGISKDRRTKSTNPNFQNYNFRGIEDIYNVITPMLAEEGILCLPDVLEQTQTLIQGRNGSTSRLSFVRVRYTLISATDGSSKSGVSVGEAMDSGDKSLSKAMSIAHKTFYEQAFSIPTKPQQKIQNYQDLDSPQLFNNQVSTPNNVFPSQEELDQFINLLGALGRSYPAFLKNRQLVHEQVTRDILKNETYKIERYIESQSVSNLYVA